MFSFINGYSAWFPFVTPLYVFIEHVQHFISLFVQLIIIAGDTALQELMKEENDRTEAHAFGMN